MQEPGVLGLLAFPHSPPHSAQTPAEPCLCPTDTQSHQVHARQVHHPESTQPGLQAACQPQGTDEETEAQTAQVIFLGPLPHPCSSADQKGSQRPARGWGTLTVSGWGIPM